MVEGRGGARSENNKWGGGRGAERKCLRILSNFGSSGLSIFFFQDYGIGNLHGPEKNVIWLLQQIRQPKKAMWTSSQPNVGLNFVS